MTFINSSKFHFTILRSKGGNMKTEEAEKNWIGMKSTLDCQANKRKNCIWLCESITNTNKPFAVCCCIPAGPVQAYINTLMHAKWTNFEVPPVFAFKLILHQHLNVPIKKIKASETKRNRVYHLIKLTKTAKTLFQMSI